MNTIAQGGVLDKLKDVQGQVAPKIPVDANISELLSATNIITLVFFLAGISFLFSLLLAAWNYVNGAGDQKKIAESTQRLLNSFFGIVIVLASFIVVRLILAVLGLDNLI